MVSSADPQPEPGDTDGMLEVEVIYAEPQSYHRVALSLPAGSTLQQAVEASGLIQKFPEIDLANNKLGIYGRIAKSDTVLQSQDRVEIYRPVDSREIRRRRAAAGAHTKAERRSKSGRNSSEG